MSTEELEFFLHREGAKPRAIKGHGGETLKEVLIRAEVIKAGQEDVLVFVGECAEALDEPQATEGGADAQAPVDVELTLEALEIKRHRHVHCHRVRHIEVDVNFTGATKHRRFSPAATVEVATKWARRKFKLDPAAGGDYVLQLCGTDVRPRADVHFGELVEAPKCKICFDLVEEKTDQG